MAGGATLQPRMLCFPRKREIVASQQIPLNPLSFVRCFLCPPSLRGKNEPPHGMLPLPLREQCFLVLSGCWGQIPTGKGASSPRHTFECPTEFFLDDGFLPRGDPVDSTRSEPPTHPLPPIDAPSLSDNAASLKPHCTGVRRGHTWPL